MKKDLIIDVKTGKRQEIELPPDPILPAQVKAEAMRRILDIAPEWKQRNLTAQAAILAKKGEANWTAEEQSAWDAGEEIWYKILQIRAASDQIEALDPIPQDFAESDIWPVWP